MKGLPVLILILLLVAVALPLAMGEMGDCPMCTSPRTIALGMCAGVLAPFILIVLLGSSRLRLGEQTSRLFFLSRSIYRPPRAP